MTHPLNEKLLPVLLALESDNVSIEQKREVLKTLGNVYLLLLHLKVSLELLLENFSLAKEGGNSIRLAERDFTTFQLTMDFIFSDYVPQQLLALSQHSEWKNTELYKDFLETLSSNFQGRSTTKDFPFARLATKDLALHFTDHCGLTNNNHPSIKFMSFFWVNQVALGDFLTSLAQGNDRLLGSQKDQDIQRYFVIRSKKLAALRGGARISEVGVLNESVAPANQTAQAFLGAPVTHARVRAPEIKDEKEDDKVLRFVLETLQPHFVETARNSFEKEQASQEARESQQLRAELLAEREKAQAEIQALRSHLLQAQSRAAELAVALAEAQGRLDEQQRHADITRDDDSEGDVAQVLGTTVDFQRQGHVDDSRSAVHGVETFAYFPPPPAEPVAVGSPGPARFNRRRKSDGVALKKVVEDDSAGLPDPTFNAAALAVYGAFPAQADTSAVANTSAVGNTSNAGGRLRFKKPAQ